MKYRNTLALVTSAILATAAYADAAGQATKPTQTAAASTQPAAAPTGTATPAGAATPSSASDEQIAELSKPSGGPNGGLYTVKDGNKVDPKTLQGWKTWRALACERCHGAEQEGPVVPPLVVSL